MRDAPQPVESLVVDYEQRLRRCEHNLVHILDAAPEGILIHRGLRYIYANLAALKLVGRSREEVIGHSPFELVAPRFRLLLAERIMEAYTTRTPRPDVEERLLHASGLEVPVEVVTLPVIFAGELATLVHIRDITARRELEIRLRAADRLASAALIAAGVAHEIDDPLTHALSTLETLAARVAEERSESAPEIRQLVAAVQDGVKRAAHVTRDVKVFASAQRVRPVPVDIRKVIEASLSFLGPEMRSRANVVERYGEVPRVLGNEARLAQVFINLLSNAVKALADRDRGPNDVTITTKARGDAAVVVEIKDSGLGLPQERESAVLEPLFTTKPDGWGVGLALCKELVSREGGEISVESVLGSGTTFTVTLQAAPRVEPPAARAARERSSGKRVLIVDDEPRVAAALKTALGSHHTTIATSGHEALQRLHAGEAYDLIVCDLLMENIDGIDLHRRIEGEWPGLHSRMIFLTGDAFISRTQEFLARVPNRHLQKPVDPEALLDVVDDVLSTFA